MVMRRWLYLLIFVVTVITVPLIADSVGDVVKWWRTNSWLRVPGQVLQIQVRHVDEGSVVTIQYSYSVGGRHLKGVWEGSILPRTVNEGKSCWVLVNPLNPTDSQLDIGFPIWVYFILCLVIPFWTFAIMFYRASRMSDQFEALWSSLDLERYDGATPLPAVSFYHPIVDTGHYLEMHIANPPFVKFAFVYLMAGIFAGYLFMERQVGIDELLKGLACLLSLLGAAFIMGYALCQCYSRIVIDSSAGELRWTRHMLHWRVTKRIPLSQVRVVSRPTGCGSEGIAIDIEDMLTGLRLNVAGEDSSSVVPNDLK